MKKIIAIALALIKGTNFPDEIFFADRYLLTADNSAINHKVYATIGVQYSEVCQLPDPLTGISS